MAQATRKKREEPALGVHIAKGVREAALWGSLGIAALLLIALATYQPADPGFSFTGEPGPIRNWIGRAGAWTSDLLLTLIGYPAFLFPILIAHGGFMIFRSGQGGDNSVSINKAEVSLRLGGFLFTLASASGLASLHWSTSGSLPVDAGGILGRFVGYGLENVMSYVGATLLLLTVFLGSVTLFTGVSWLMVMDLTGRYTLTFIDIVKIRFERVRQTIEDQRSRQQRIQLVKVQREASKDRQKPRIEPIIKRVKSSARVERERQVPMFDPPSNTELPPLSILDSAPAQDAGYSSTALEAMSRVVEIKLRDFGIEAEVVAVHPGPVITRFELQLAAGVKVNQITNLAKDLARALSAISVRVVEVIPGKSTVGLEIPNESRELVTLGEILKSQEYDAATSPLTLALGKDISGYPIVADLSRMPHLLIAGTTGAGKSVALNAMVLSLLYKATPEQVRVIMIDPKMLELSVYEGIPHLLTPVVTDVKEAANAFRWCVAEMDRRYRLMATLGVRNISTFNRRVREAITAKQPIPDPLFKPEETLDGENAETPTLTPLPLIVVVVDELADMMMVVGKKVEELIARLAQKARASGIHLVLATQRPSVDVLTGLIKANIPCRIAFQVSSRVDSRTILDQIGAESLLGHGDMLYLPLGTAVPYRIHGAFVSDQEVHRVVAHLKKAGAPRYLEEILEGPTDYVAMLAGITGEDTGDVEQDPLYDQAVRIVTETRKASISGVQRRL